jgi:hypothetical protein
MARMVSVPFIFQNQKHYVLIRYSNAGDYSSLRKLLLHNGLQKLTEEDSTLIFEQGYLWVDYKLVHQDPTGIKWLVLAALDEYFQTQKALKLFGGISLASAS